MDLFYSASRMAEPIADTGTEVERPAPLRLWRRPRFAWVLGIALLLIAITFAITVARLRFDLYASQESQAQAVICNEMASLVDDWSTGLLEDRIMERRADGGNGLIRFAYSFDGDRQFDPRIKVEARRSFFCPGSARGPENSNFPILTSAVIGKSGGDAVIVGDILQRWPEQIGEKGDREVIHTQSLQISYAIGENLRSVDDRILLASAVSLLGLLVAGSVAAWVHYRFTRGIARVNAAFEAVRQGDWQARASAGADLAEIAELTARANMALSQIESQMRTLQLWGPRMAHDLLDPLALLQAQIGAADIDSGTRGAIEARLNGVIAMSRGLLEIAGAASAPTHPVDISALATQAATDLAAELDPDVHSVVAEIAPGVMAMAREASLATILSNLVGNARRHAAPGILTVRLTRARGGRPHFDLTIENAALGGDAATRRFGLGLETARIVALSLGMTTGLRVRDGRAVAWLSGPSLD